MHFGLKIITTLLAGVIAAANISTALAQTSVSPPTPGAVITPIDKPVVQPATTPAPSIGRSEEKEFKPLTDAKKIQVDRFELIGNKLFDDEVLLGEITDYAGSPITLEEIYQAADSIQRFYRDQGYLLASVYVPSQKISSGTVKLEIIEGRLESVQVDGKLDSYNPKFLIGQFDSMTLGEVILDTELEREMLLLNDLPGLAARAVIFPGVEYGASNVTIMAEEDRATTTLRLNNHGRESLGEARLEAGWLYANPLFQGDQLNLSAIVAEDSSMAFGRFDYDALVNASGSRVGFGVSTFAYEVDTEAIGLVGTLEGDGVNVRLLFTHPLLRKQRNRLDLGLVVRRNETSEDGSLAVSTVSKSINVLDISLRWQPTHDDGSQTSVNVSLSSNFENDKNGAKTDALKAKLSLDYSYSKPFAKSWFVLLRANLVVSKDPLPDVERYRLGGPNSVRAFPSAELAGDEGGFLSLDVGKIFKISAKTNWGIKLFADTGKVRRTLPAAGELAEESLAGYGLGLSFNIGGKHSFELEVMDPKSDQISSDKRDTRGWISYSARF